MTVLKKCRNRFAFSLAEVLITLGVIGVVAAMTIPNLIANYQKDQTVTKLKSTYAILNNALDQSKIENGTDLNTWYVPNDTAINASTYFAQNYLLPNVKVSTDCGTSSSGDCHYKVSYLDKDLGDYYMAGSNSSYAFFLLNGSCIAVNVYKGTDTSVKSSRVFLNIDINGKKSPNILGKDVFLVELGSLSGDKNKFVPYSINVERASLLNQPDGTDCNKSHGNGFRCFALIVKDGWKIADDYPWN